MNADKSSDRPIIIRQSEAEDALGATTVFYKAWLAAYPNKEAGITVDDIEDSYKDSFTEEHLANAARNYGSRGGNIMRLMAIDSSTKTIVGTCAVVRNEDHNLFRTIYILPEYQHQGIGTRLWDEAKKFLDPSKETIVNVASYNKNAIAFYAKLGFVDTGKRFTEERFRFKSGAILPETEMKLDAGKL